MTETTYQRKVALKLIDKFRRDFYDKTGLRAMVHVNHMPKDELQTVENLSVISLKQVEQVFTNALPKEIQEKFVLRTRSRKRDVVDLRSMFCSIAYRLNFTFSSIGKHIGKDHTTIIYLNKKAEWLVETDPRFASLYNSITEKMTKVYDENLQ